MARIIRFSQLFDPLEDRIAFVTQDDTGATTRLWLTQRLCQRLIGALVPKLAEIRAAPTQAAPDPTILSWEQAAAMAQLEPAPPVVPSTETTTGLVQTVNIAPVNGDFVLTFGFGEAEFAKGQQRALALTPIELRQTMSVLHRLYVTAGWPLDAWPAWISGAEAAQAPLAEGSMRIN